MNTKYVVSLELAKQLKEAGIPQESEFYWYYSMYTGGKWKLFRYKGFVTEKKKLLEQGNLISAFHLGELGEMLPIEIDDFEVDDENYGTLSLVIWRYVKDWFVNYMDEDVYPQIQYVGNTEAEARGKTLLYLIKEELLKEK